ncbi:hypothetical protein NA56DRAFT_320440 [Hyaloscypha hepaticicola]|uniref:Uncharacterized protein n=1 Tax=Hyaloscypha hepaticicola TaxID=2082293 RepID=A0A2J6PPZ5_9HELO|nr:hypothetical protein NA56DRAFT_320440 [Hyaloscypha hepaticicola]
MMGRPQYSNNKSNNKDKSKSKRKSASHKTNPSPAMPASSSSMDPQNGSAIDQSGQSSREHGDNSYSHPSRDSRQTPHRTQTNTVNGGQDCNEPQYYEPQYNSAHTYATHPPEQRVPVPPAAHDGEEQYYYSSYQIYTNDAGAYARELRLDDDQALSQDPLHTSSSNAHQYDQPADHGYYRPHSPFSQYPVQQHVSTSSTTARWSREPTPEESFRVNGRRYRTEAEAEAARRAIEEATQQADRYGPARQ